MKWGNHPRRRTTPDIWRKPLRWNKRAARAGHRSRVFCASLADVFDNQVEPSWRADLWQLIRETPALDWLLLTKRRRISARCCRLTGATAGRNVWLGTTTEDAEHYRQRWPILAAPGKAAVRLLRAGDRTARRAPPRRRRAPDWVICGGESGGQRRPLQTEWVRDVRDQCEAHGISFFFKQTAACAGTAAAASSTVASGRNGRWRRERRSRAVAPHRHRENPRSRIAIR